MPIRSHVLTPLIQKCQQMFIACTHTKMYHITSVEYDEFINTLRSARAAFMLTPGGMVQFTELLHSLRRSKSCKKISGNASIPWRHQVLPSDAIMAY
ncbi:hypothetical protein MRX96_008940 [Rhipicephalus microplus]